MKTRDIKIIVIVLGLIIIAIAVGAALLINNAGFDSPQEKARMEAARQKDEARLVTHKPEVTEPCAMYPGQAKYKGGPPLSRVCTQEEKEITLCKIADEQSYTKEQYKVLGYDAYEKCRTLLRK